MCSAKGHVRASRGVQLRADAESRVKTVHTIHQLPLGRPEHPCLENDRHPDPYCHPDHPRLENHLMIICSDTVHLGRGWLEAGGASGR